MSNPCPKRKLRAAAAARHRLRHREERMFDKQMRKLSRLETAEEKVEELNRRIMLNWYRSMIIWKVLTDAMKTKGGGLRGYIIRSVASDLVMRIDHLHKHTHYGNAPSEWLNTMKWGEWYDEKSEEKSDEKK